MRTIEFRGKDKDTGNWIYGYYGVNLGGLPVIAYHHRIGQSKKLSTIQQFVIPETVGQFTGLFDKNGNKIFEGDIVCWSNDVGEVVFTDVSWAIRIPKLRLPQIFDKYLSKSFNIIGNIHDNPELLK